MRSFIVKIIYFTLPLLILMVAVEAWLENLPNDARNKHLWMLRHSRQVKTLVLGHSHNLYGIRPTLLGEGAFNLAFDSQSYRYDNYLLQHYPLDSLRTLILNFDYFQAWEDLESQPDMAAWGLRYSIYMKCDIHPRLSQYGLEVLHPKWVKDRLFSKTDILYKACDSLGWGTTARLETRPPNWNNGQRRAEGNTYHNEDLLLLNENFLRQMFDFCRARHIRVLLLNTPVTAEFRKHEDSRQVVKNERLLHKLRHDYPEIEYLNMESDPRFVDDDFYDSDHLNHHGATKLTKLLKDHIDTTWLHHSPSIPTPCSSTH